MIKLYFTDPMEQGAEAARLIHIYTESVLTMLLVLNNSRQKQQEHTLFNLK